MTYGHHNRYDCKFIFSFERNQLSCTNSNQHKQTTKKKGKERTFEWGWNNIVDLDKVILYIFVTYKIKFLVKLLTLCTTKQINLLAVQLSSLFKCILTLIANVISPIIVNSPKERKKKQYWTERLSSSLPDLRNSS